MRKLHVSKLSKYLRKLVAKVRYKLWQSNSRVYTLESCTTLIVLDSGQIKDREESQSSLEKEE